MQRSHPSRQSGMFFQAEVYKDSGWFYKAKRNMCMRSGLCERSDTGSSALWVRL